MAAIVTLTTDFGTADIFVGTMKGVILSRCPEAQLVDLTHEIPPQDVWAGALRLAAAARYFPAGTVHLAVVDPGVGSERRPIAIEASGQRFVGPDNGLLTLAAPPGGSDWRAVQLASPAHRLDRVSNTFHGRDLFAPAAAALACGVALDDLGPPVASVFELRVPAVERDSGTLRGIVLDIDHFGNLITSISAADLDGLVVKEVRVGRLRLRGLSTFYDASRPAVAVIDSEDRLEVAVPGGNAAAAHGIVRGQPVEVRVRRPA